MAHASKQIRDALVTALTGLTTTGANVSNSVYPEATLPSLRVYFASEALPDEFQAMGSIHYRVASFRVEIRVEDESLQDQLDTIRTEIEIAIAADDTLGLTGVKVMYTGTGTASYEMGAEQPRALLPLLFDVHHRTTDADPETLIT